MTSHPHINHIEKLRGISVLLVLGYHVQFPFFQNGFLGVDVFFVLSGYLMATVYGHLASATEVKDYLIRRLSRLLPAYYCVLFLTLWVSACLLLTHEVLIVTRQAIWSAFLLPNIGYYQATDYFDHTYFRPLLNLWSLGVEIQFYLVFPILLYIHRRYPKTLLLLTVLALSFFIIVDAISPKTAFYMMPTRIWEFMTGFYCAKFTRAGSRMESWIGTAALLLLLVLLCALPSLSLQHQFPGSLLTVLLAGLIITFGFSTGSQSHYLSRALTRLGQYSYSIYLVHFPIIVLVNYQPFQGTVLTPHSMTSTALILLLTATLSIALYRLVENPMRRSLNARHILVGITTLSLASILIVLPIKQISKMTLDPKIFKISLALEDRDSFRCNVFQLISEPSSDSCLLSTGSTGKNYLLVGNSHADAIKTSLANILELPGHSLRLMKDNSAANEVLTPNRITQEAIQHGIDVIILHSRSGSDNVQIIEELLSITRELNIRVVYIDPVPMYSFNVPERLYQDLLKYGRTRSSGLTAEDYRKNNQKLFQGLAQFTDRYGHFVRLKITTLLCPSECLIEDSNGVPFYYDTDHLTLTGATILNPIFQEIAQM